MPLVVADRVRETTTTTGTGTVTLAGAVTGYQSFSAIGNGNTTYYTINAGSQFEVGIGTYLGAGPTLSRDTVLESSNAGALVNFSAGTKDVFVTYPAEKSISDGYGLLPVANGGTGQSSYTNGQLLIGNTTGNTLTKTTLTAGTNVTITNGSGSITINAADQYVGTVTSVSGTGTVNGITLTGTVTTSGSLTLGGTLSGVSLTSQVTGTLPVGNGGTGATTLTANGVLYGSGTSAIAATAVGTTGQVLVGNTGAAPTWSTLSGIGVTSFSAGTTGLTPSSATTGVVTLAGTLGVANGGTGATTLTSGYLLKGNGTSAVSASVVYDDGTNVGVGTTSPNSKFDVRGTINASDGTNGNVRAYVDATSAYLQSLNQAANAYQPLLIMGSTVAFANNGTTRMTLDTFGTLGLGTTTGGGKLNIKEGSTNFEVNTSGVSADLLAYDRGASAYKLLKFRGSEFTFNPGDVEKIRIDTVGNLGLNTTTPVGRLSVVSGSSTGVATGAWSNNYSVFGPNAGSTTGAAVALGYNSAIDAAEILALAPGVAWKPLNLYSAGLNLYASSGGIGASLNGSGTFSAVTDIRAPIFYDSADTAYFLDAASTGTALSTNGILIAGTGTSGGVQNRTYTAGRNRIWSFANADTYGISYFQGGPDYIGLHVAGTATQAGSDFWVSSAGIAQVRNEMRAPIFYDSDNTSYYLDPSSNTTSLRTNGAWITNPTSTWGGEVAGKLEYHNNRWYASVNTAFVVRSTTGSEVFWAYNTGVVEASSDFRAPVFYDTNNTAFYANMDGTSEFNTIQTRGGSGFRSFATPAASVNSQLYFADAGNTRAWNWQLDENNNAALWNYNGSGWAKRMGVTSPDSELYLRNSSGSDVSLAYPATFGYSSSYKTMVLGNQAYTTVCIGVSPASNPSGSFNGAGSGVEVMFKNGVYFISPNSANNSYNNYLRLIDGYVQFTNSARAPIFYDSDNTGYYGDFASTSVLFGLTITGTGNKYLQIQSTDSGEAMVRYLGATGPSWYVGKRTSTSLVDTASFHFYSESAGATVAGIDVSGNMLASGSFRAPIFYDSNNTGYYLDPASGTVLNRLVSITGAGNSNGGNLQLGDKDVNTAKWSVMTGGHYGGTSEPKGVMLIGSYSSSGANQVSIGGNVYEANPATQIVFFTATTATHPTGGTSRLSIDGNGVVTANVDIRAPIFYDSNNTAYYVDPASTSVLNTTFIGTHGKFYDDGNFHIDGVASPVWINSLSNSTIELNTQTSGYVNIGNSARAPIYYDSANTAYYVDPVSGSRLGGNVTFDGGSFVAANGDFIARRSSGSTGVYYFVTTGSAYLYYDGSSYIFGASGPVTTTTSFRAPIFYDSDNTGFFVNPATSSTLANIDVASVIDSAQYYDAAIEIRERGFGGALTTALSNAPRLGFHWGGRVAMQLVLDSGGTFNVMNGDTTAYSAFRASQFFGDVFYENSNNAFYLDPASTGTSLNVAGSIVAAGNVTAYSDIRVKANVEMIPSALDKLDQIRGVTYTRTDLADKERRYAGVIAQEIEQVLPEAVRDLGNIKAVDYNATIALLIQAVKELTDKVKALEAKEQ